ncbi:hypothetical protein AOLI_G00052940 [Acnodon oligacanthus]
MIQFNFILLQFSEAVLCNLPISVLGFCNEKSGRLSNYADILHNIGNLKQKVAYQFLEKQVISFCLFIILASFLFPRITWNTR